MVVSPGTLFEPSEILASLCAGGTGDEYRALDTWLAN